jgi:hypothetical protein
MTQTHVRSMAGDAMQGRDLRRGVSQARRLELPVTGLAVATGLALAVGMLPYLRWIGAAPYALAVALAAGAMAGFALRTRQTRSTERPSASEWLLAAWSVLPMPTAVSMLSLLNYAALFWGTRGLLVALAAFGWTPAVDASAVALWGSAALAVPLTLGSLPRVATDLAERLYPDSAGSRSAFYALLLERRKLLIGLVAAALVLGAGVWALWENHLGLAAFSVAFLIYTALPLDKRARVRSTPTGKRNAIDGLAAALREGGYGVVEEPRTGRAGIDPLITDVDLLVRSADRLYALEYKEVPPDGKGVDWQTASRLRTAAGALEDGIDMGRAASIEPLLVVVGGAPEESLANFCRAEGVGLAHLEPDAFGELLTAMRKAKGREIGPLAAERLGLLPAPTGEESGA